MTGHFKAKGYSGAFWSQGHKSIFLFHPPFLSLTFIDNLKMTLVDLYLTSSLLPVCFCFPPVLSSSVAQSIVQEEPITLKSSVSPTN